MDPEDFRLLCIERLEADDFKFTKTARTDGYGLGYTELSMVDLILDRLRAGFPLNEVQLGTPPGSLGTGYSLTNVDGKGLYIKLKLVDDYALIMSFHTSKH
jgi:hypothetical protein